MAAPTFNYPSFCNVLSVFHIYNEIDKFLENQQSVSQNLRDTVTREIYKMLMNQISSLKNLELYSLPLNNIKNIPKFTSFPGANECLKNLSELHCYSNNNPELLYQLSQICRNIRSLKINLHKVTSNGIADLISVQQNLKYLVSLRTSLTNLPNTLIKLDLYEYHAIPLLFIARLTMGRF